MGGFKDQPEEEGGFGIPLGQKSDRPVDDPVGVGKTLGHRGHGWIDLVAAQAVTAIHASVGCLFQPIHIVVGQEGDMLKAHARPAGGEVHLANALGLIAGLAGQTAGEAGLPVDGRADAEVVGQAEARSDLAGQHGHSLRHANWAIGVGLAKANPLGGQLVDMRGHHWMASPQAAQTIPAPLVGGDHDDVGTLIGELHGWP